MTKAHVFAESWTKLFDEPNDTREHEVVHRYTDPVTGEQSVFRRAKTFALKSRTVCGTTCNAGWLKDLEERVEPVMRGFAGNTKLALTSPQQADLALWACASSAIAMQMDETADGFASPDFARELYRDRRPPLGTDVFLGANTHGEMGWFGAHSMTIMAAPERRHAWGALLTFGHGILYVVHHGLPETRLRPRRHVNLAMRPIWPPRDRIFWPPPLAIAPRDLWPLADEVFTHSSWERAARSDKQCRVLES
jgi:hypothetical protein